MSDESTFQVIELKIKGFICTTAHPLGCQRIVDQQIAFVADRVPAFSQYRRALVLGASAGYGLASRLVLAVAGQASTIGVFLEREPKGKREVLKSTAKRKITKSIKKEIKN